MRLLTLNVILALIWAALLGDLSLPSLLSGYGLGYLLLLMLFRSQEEGRYFRKVPQIIGFIFYYIWELFKSNIIIAWEVLTPHHNMRPGVIAIPLDAKTDVEITVLANLISMTPGTLSLDVSTDRKVLYLHTLYVDDPELIRQQTKNKLERRVLNILR